MSDPSVPPNVQPARSPHEKRAHALAGSLGGLLGGMLAGGFGSVIGLCIVNMGPPQSGTLLPNLADGIAIGGLAAGAVGILSGLLIGRQYGQRRAFVWTGWAAFWSVLVSSIELMEEHEIADALRTFVVGMVLMLTLFAAGRWLLRGLWLRWVWFWLGDFVSDRRGLQSSATADVHRSQLDSR